MKRFFIFLMILPLLFARSAFPAATLETAAGILSVGSAVSRGADPASGGFYNLSSGDCNGDGRINGKDLVRLIKYLSYYDDETGVSAVTLGPVPCAEHSWGDWEIVQEPTAFRSGIIRRICSECFLTEEDTVAPLGGEIAGVPELYAHQFGITPGLVDAEALNALMLKASAENRTVRFGDGTYVFPSALQVYSNTSITGSANTVFTLSADASDKVLMRIDPGADNVFISHLVLQGEHTSAPSQKGETVGLYISGTARINIENVEFAGFGLYGMYAASTSSTGVGEFYKMIQMTNCRFYLNYCGLCLGPRCEYTQTLNCVFGKNHIGCLNQGGNNSYVSCIFNVNSVGFRLDSANLSNPAHGGCNGCTFNHNGSPVVVNDCELGWLFDGCRIFYGQISVNRSRGVVFDSCIFGSCRLACANAGNKNANLISDSFFQTDKNAVLAGNDGSFAVVSCLPEDTEEPPVPEPSGDRILYTLSDDSAPLSPLSTNAYSGALGLTVPADTFIDRLDLVTANAAGGTVIKDINVWVFNGETGTVAERLTFDLSAEVKYSEDLGRYVVSIGVGRSFGYPASFIVQCTRVNSASVAYYNASGSRIGWLRGDTAPVIGEELTPNSRVVPVCAVYTGAAG